MRTLLVAVALLASFVHSFAGAPDFAFPERVSANALASYKNAVKQGDELTALRQVMDYYLAQTAKSAENRNAALDFVAAKTAGLKNPVFRALGRTFYASALQACYEADRWSADNRVLPLYPLPEDVALWSGAQYRHVIDSLYADALLHPELLRSVPVTQYPSIVEIERSDVSYYPSILDFIACKAEARPIDTSDSYNPLSADRLVSLSPLPELSPSILADYSYRIAGRDSLSDAVVLAAYERLENGFDLFCCDFEQRVRLSNEFYALLLAPDGRPATEAAGVVLTSYYFWPSGAPRRYQTLEAYNKAFPSSRFQPKIAEALHSLKQPAVTLALPAFAMPGEPFSVRAEGTNVKSAQLRIYRADGLALGTPTQRDDTYVKGAPYKIFDIAFPEKPVGESSEAAITISLPEKGIYVATLNFPGMETSGRYVDTSRIYVSGLRTIAFGSNEYDLLVADAMTGDAIKDANIYFQNNNRTVSSVGLSDASGYFRCGTKSGTYFAAKDGDKFSPGIDYYYYEESKPRTFKASRFFTAQPIYHPGDTIEWAAVVYESRPDGNSLPVVGEEFAFVLYGSNGVATDTTRLTTDIFGRVTGRFATDENALTGNYSIRTEAFRVGNVEVSDYKLPTFEVLTDAPVWTADSLVLTGRVMAYTGQPMAGAKVTLSLSTRSVWWRSSGSANINLRLESEAGADGRFRFALPVAGLPQKSLPLVYVEQIAASSLTGESQTASNTFWRRMPYFVKADISENIRIDKGGTDIKAGLYNALDSLVSTDLDFSLSRGDTTVTAGSLNDGILRIAQLSRCKSGEYRLKIFARDTELLSDTLSSDVVLYRADDSASPVPDRFVWCPEKAFTLTPNEAKCKLLFALNHQATLRAFLSDSTGIVSRVERKFQAGMHNLEFEVPKECSVGMLHLIIIGGGKVQTLDFNVKREDSRSILKFTAESFRDRLTPGNAERWTFRVSDASGAGRHSAVIAGMYNSALEALAKSNWSLSTPKRSRLPWRNFMNDSGYGALHGRGANFKGNSGFMDASIQPPAFVLYNRSLSSYRLRGGVVREMKAAATVNGAFYAETMDVEEEAAEEAMPAAGASRNLMMRKFSSDSGVEADVVTEEDADIVEEEFDFRDAETPLAFFRPMLTTDAEGVLELSFTVPDANARWAFRMVAFTDSLLSTSFARDVVASKPLMVKPNLPRYIRSGDRVEVVSEIRNASDFALAIVTTVEVFNPLTGSVLETKRYENRLSPDEMTVVSTLIDVPSDITVLGYRIKSSSDTFADGEQNLLPVLPASTPVLGSVPFFVNADSADFSVSIPELPASANVSFEYCNNPAWYLVSSLPALAEGLPSTSPEAARQIYSACVARSILENNPEIAAALKVWSQNPDDRMLTSMLEKNTSLKQLLLEATPWAGMAADETQRMSRLSELLSAKNIEATLRDAFKTLKDLSVSGGGLKWCAGSSDASVWATTEAMRSFALMARLGVLPDDSETTALIRSNFAYLDNKVKEDFIKHPKSVYNSYLLIRRLLSDVVTTPGPTAAVEATVQNLVRNWRKMSVGAKAEAAMILTRSGYRRVAVEVMQSVAEFATVSPSRGAYFPSLDDTWFGSLNKVGITAEVMLALSDVNPESPLIAGLAQWLITEKSVTDWGSGTDATFAIAALVGYFPSAFAEKPLPEVFIGSTPLKIDASAQNLTGEVSVGLCADSVAGRSLRIANHTDVPSWGAVMWNYVDSMSNVAKSGSAELSIDKKFVVVDANGEISASKDFRVADRVRVTLTIETDIDLDYVTIVDERPASFEPVNQLPAPVFSQGLFFYLENRDASTRLFIDNLPKGKYVLSYDMWCNNAGQFTDGLATVQSQYAPRYVAHSAGGEISVIRP